MATVKRFPYLSETYEVWLNQTNPVLRGANLHHAKESVKMWKRKGEDAVLVKATTHREVVNAEEES